MADHGVHHGDRADKEGWLHKQSAWLKEWRKRYFRLVKDMLFFSKTAQDPPHGHVSLRDCLTVKSADEKTGKSHSFEVSTPDQTYFMFAETAQEKDDWIATIGRAIVRITHEGSANEDGDESDDSEDEADYAGNF